MVCRRSSVQPLSEPLMTCWQLEVYEEASVKFELKLHFNWFYPLNKIAYIMIQISSIVQDGYYFNSNSNMLPNHSIVSRQWFK